FIPSQLGWRFLLMVMRTVYRRTHHPWNNPGEAHYLTFSCFKKRAFLARDRTRQYFLDALASARTRHLFDLWAYVIMPTHAHLLLFPRREHYDMGAIETSIKLSVSRRAMAYLRKHNPDGLRHLATGHIHTPYRFWTSGNGYDQNLVALNEARNMATYIHNNPVCAGLCTEAEAWPWSSAREWIEEGSGPLSIDRDSFPEA
ncbi:MAG: transposase, partial [Candidatus Hydrogenedentes bacterium]|nr:transposase [Candidatus Hydrogenedentota bacterium]